MSGLFPRGRGALRETPVSLALGRHLPSYLVGATEVEPPADAFGLLPYAPLGRDQGGTEFCFAFGPTSATYTLLGALGAPAPLCSAPALGTMAKVLAGQDLAQVGEGGYPSASFRVIKDRLGLVPDSDRPLLLDANGNPLDPTVLTTLPPIGAVADTSVALSTVLLDGAVDLVLAAKRWLAPAAGAPLGRPLTLNLQVGDAFQRLGPGQIWQGRDANAGWHCVTGLAFDADSLWILNSWGLSWAGCTDKTGRVWPGLGRVAWSAIAREAQGLIGADGVTP